MKPSLRTSKMTRWRAASLIGVHVLAAIHFLHWKLNGWTLAPVEPSEMFDTLHLGIITVGFLFMAGLVVATAIAGRFFCSWGCHILALQDLSAWILRELRIQARPIRSRTLVWVPPLAVLYLFVWPQVERLLAGQPLPALHVVSDQEGWSSFVTNDLLRSFPGLGMTLVTFLVCGFAIVYFLGSRSFCSYACPYGAMFAVADRVAPLRIVASDGDCSKCGACIAACPSHVQVINEVDRYGMVVNTNCFKDLDCVSVCPTDALKLGFARPPAARSWWKRLGLDKRYDFSLGEDLLMAGAFVVLLPILRGLYDAVSFLLALAVAAILSYFAVVALRLWRCEQVDLGHLALKRDGRWTSQGRASAVVLALVAAFVVHSGWVQYHLYAGQLAVAKLGAFEYQRALPSVPNYTTSLEAASGKHAAELAAAIAHFEKAARGGLVCPRPLRLQLAMLHRQAGNTTLAQNHLNAVLASDPGDHTSRLALAWTWLRDSRAELARRQAEVVLADGSADDRAIAGAHYLLGSVEAQAGNQKLAIAHFERSLERYPDSADVQLALGALLAASGKLDDAVARFEDAVEIRPELAPAHNNLAAVLVRLDRQEEALEHYRRAAELTPGNPLTETNLGTLLLEMGNLAEAEAIFKKVLSRTPDYAEAQKGQQEVQRRLQK